MQYGFFGNSLAAFLVIFVSSVISFSCGVQLSGSITSGHPK